MLKKFHLIIILLQQNIFSSVICCYDNYDFSQFTNIEKSINDSADPCEDFYEYACGNYNNENTNPNYNEITGLLDYKLNLRMLQDTRSHPYEWNVQTYLDKMQIYFEACKRETRRNIRRYFDEVKPGLNIDWPLLNNRRSVQGNDFDLWGLAGQLQSYGLNNLLIYRQITRNNNGTLSVVLSPIFIEENGSLPEAVILQVLLQGLGLTNPDKYIEQINTTDHQWLEMIKQYPSTGEEKTLLFEDLNNEYSKLNLQLFLKELLGHDVANISTITIENPAYFAYLNLKIWQPEDLKNLCNYLMIKFLFYLAVDSTTEFTPLACIRDVRNKFDLAANFRYNRTNLKRDKSKEDVLQMMEQIRLVMAKYFNRNVLNISPQQIEFLQNKLEAIKVNIGNLPETLTLQQLNEYYEEVPLLDTRNYYKNHLLLLKHRFRKSLLYTQNQSHYIVNDNRLGSSSGPYYVLQQNLIIIPFASLQHPMFHKDYSPLHKMSLLGFVLAHELTHAFDMDGLYFDNNGSPLYKNSVILAHKNFTKSVNCMQHQLPTANINERIADLFAVRLAYRSFVENFSDSSGDWKRKFFLYLAQFFCGTNKVEFIDHDSDSIRLQQIVMNFEPFAKAFECRKGSRMNPIVKCRLY